MTTHQRIRPFNTKETYPEQNLDNDLSQGVVARGTMVFLRGQVSQDLDTRESLHAGDAAQQTETKVDHWLSYSARRFRARTATWCRFRIWQITM